MINRENPIKIREREATHEIWRLPIKSGGLECLADVSTFSPLSKYHCWPTSSSAPLVIFVQGSQSGSFNLEGLMLM